MKKITHPELLALKAEVEASPSDNGARLVLADWLEDHDDPDFAEGLRYSVRRKIHPKKGKVGFLWSVVALDHHRLPSSIMRVMHGGSVRYHAEASLWEAYRKLGEVLRIMREDSK